MRLLTSFVCVFVLLSVAEAKRNAKDRSCSKRCNKKLQPVCGSDGTTYENLCLLNNAKCEAAKNGSVLTVKSRGSCENSSADDDKEKSCPSPLDCTPVNSTKHSVCGSDNVTYSTFCFFRIARCQANQNKGVSLTMMYKGECGKPKSTSVCPTEGQCDSKGRPICGSDGKTYKNTCLFVVAKCQAKMESKKLKLTHKGPCKVSIKQCPKSCPNKEKPVCGTDGKTYKNGCHLEAAKCKLPKKDQRKLRVQFAGRCEAPVTPKPCLTLEQCKQIKKPVCGTDGKTYPNMCRLRVAKCHAKRNKHKAIEMKYKGECKRGSKRKNTQKGRKGRKGRRERKNERID